MNRRGFLGWLTGIVAAPFVPVPTPAPELVVTHDLSHVVTRAYIESPIHRNFVQVTAFGDSHPIYVLADRPVERDG